MPDFPESLDLEHLFDADIDLAPGERIGATPFGHRSTIIVTGGTIEGPRLRGTMRPGGGDWLLTSGTHNELDVRATIETHDGALIHLWYRGVLKAEPDVMRRVLSGEDVSTREYYFRTTPRFETGDERYAWLNDMVCVAYGWFGPGKVGYRVFGVR
ncbi:MAG TPA: DUF3237 domain-containing protein [Dehalococcoidia bacterium]|jgi:hypothetical protein|nr:DUF3237 domain-containing protein [Dehalococcoidia bacterium]